MKKIKFHFSKKGAKKIFSVFLNYKYLFFLIFFSAYLGFVFRVVYEYAYVDIKFIEYEESYENMVILNIKKSNRVLKEILVNIEERDKKFEMREDVEYNNPFEFRESDILKNNETNNQDSDVDESDLKSLLPIEIERNIIIEGGN